MGSSTNFSFPYPDVGSSTDVPGDMADLAQAIDTFILDNGLRKAMGLTADRPTAGPAYEGVVYFSTDDHVFTFCDGAAWFPWPDVSSFLTIATHANTALHAVGAVVPAGTPVGNPPGSSNTAGVAATVARADHTHALAAFGAVGDVQALALDGAASAGAVGKFADAGHKHAMPALHSIIPAGVIWAWDGAAGSPPTGWLTCDGSSVLRATYPDLFAVIGTQHGAADGTHFNLPNYKGKVIVGFDASQTEFDSLADTGGAKTHAVSVAELPAHHHSVDPPSTTTGIQSANHTHNPSSGNNFITNTGGVSAAYSAGIGGTQEGSTGIQSASHTHSVDIAAFNSADTGSGTAMSLLQPYGVANYIIKT